MKLSTALGVLFFGTLFALVVVAAKEHISCQKGAEQVLREIKNNPQSKPGDPSASCVYPTARAIGTLLGGK